MPATARRKVTITYFGDVGGASPGIAQELAAADNNASPAQIQVVTLALGDNTITAPTAGTTFRSCTIVKPTANAIAIRLKGVGADTGVRLHNTDPDSVSLDPTQTTFVLNAAAAIQGVRLFWT
jgi:hypothetical protein